MEALSAEVISEALRIQEALSVPGIGCKAYSVEKATKAGKGSKGKNGTPVQATKVQNPPPAAFFHSPLLYWNCSRVQLLSDRNVVDTVNRKSFLHSYANMTVLWGSVFAGKRISQGRLHAADALVITMFYRLESGAGDKWDEKAAALLADPKNGDRYDVYPREGAIRPSRMYEFRFQPVSLFDNILLILSYTAMIAYSIRSFSRIPTVKSKSGLFLASVTQVGPIDLDCWTLLTRTVDRVYNGEFYNNVSCEASSIAYPERVLSPCRFGYRDREHVGDQILTPNCSNSCTASASRAPFSQHPRNNHQLLAFRPPSEKLASSPSLLS